MHVYTHIYVNIYMIKYKYKSEILTLRGKWKEQEMMKWLMSSISLKCWESLFSLVLCLVLHFWFRAFIKFYLLHGNLWAWEELWSDHPWVPITHMTSLPLGIYVCFSFVSGSVPMRDGSEQACSYFSIFKERFSSRGESCSLN